MKSKVIATGLSTAMSYCECLITASSAQEINDITARSSLTLNTASTSEGGGFEHPLSFHSRLTFSDCDRFVLEATMKGV